MTPSPRLNDNGLAKVSNKTACAILHLIGSLACSVAMLARPETPFWLAYVYAAFSLIHFWIRVRRVSDNLPLLSMGWGLLFLAALTLPTRWKSLLIFAILQVLVFEVLRPIFRSSQDRAKYFGSLEGIQKAFLLSGFSALIYQVAWQRRLIELVGGNAESVAVIIAIFMGGLGIGSLFADMLIKRISRYGLVIFCLFEIGIGLLGALSIPLLDYLASTLAGVPQGAGLIGFVSLILLPPTILMGATMPTLAEILKARLPLFNETVGRLYSVNALGSAIASLVTALLLFSVIGLKAVTALAALCNGATAWMVWTGSRSWAEPPATPEPERRYDRAPSFGAVWLAMPQVALLALLCGLVTLSQEVLLLKQAAWLTGGRAETFGIGVGSFLLGLASGSWKQIHIESQKLCPSAAFNWGLTTLAFSVLPFLLAYAAIPGVPIALLYLVLGFCGFLGARTLPMVTGLLKLEDQPKLGRVIAANIVGCVAGSLLIGNALVDWVGLAASMQIVAVLSLLTCLSFTWAAFSFRKSHPADASWLSGYPLMPVIGLAVAGLVAAPILADKWLERMLLVTNSPPEFVFVAESKSGIAVVHRESGRLDVFGGGVYDGAVNTQVNPDTNDIARLYRFLGMHNAPASVLEIGLSSGSWARVLATDPRVHDIVSIEINPAYRRLVAAFPEVAPVLTDPKFKLHIDDGRRWLMANPDARFDLIVSNTSFHWRAGATVITSKEFMTLAKNALRPNGILLMNTTGSPNIVTTALAVFPHVAMIRNLVIASMSPLDDNQEHAIERMTQHPNVASVEVAKKLIDTTSVRVVRTSDPNTVVIEDDTMNEEFGNVPLR